MRKKQLEQRVRDLQVELRMERNRRETDRRTYSDAERVFDEKVSELTRLEEVEIQAGAWIGSKFVCSGKYASFPFNPFATPSWPDFQVDFNGSLIPVRVIEHDELVGWTAQDLHSLEAENQHTPKVDIRKTR